MSARRKVLDTFPRLGELLIQRKLVSQEAIEHALATQRTALELDRKAPKIGEILIQNKALSRKTVKLILDEQKVARGEKRVLTIGLQEPRPGVVLLKLRGGLDKHTDPNLVRVFEKLMNRGVHRLILDCSGLVSINSYSISSLVVYIDECRARGGELVFLGMRPAVRISLERLELLEFMETFDSLDDALAALNGAEPSTPSLAEFVSSFSSKHYHFSYCSEIKRLEEETRLYYMTGDIARRNGKSSCPKCKP